MNISAVIDVNHFWAQYVDRETNGQMKLINDILSVSLSQLNPTQIEVGLICSAPFLLVSPRTSTPNQFIKRSQYYRARILHRIDNVTVEVFFVDWGNSEQVPVSQC